MLRSSDFDRIQGFDEDFAVVFNDVDLCMRVTEAGYKIVWEPRCTLYHFESKSRGSDTYGEKAKRFRRELEYMKDTWGRRIEVDPHFNPHFSLRAAPFQAIREPRIV